MLQTEALDILKLGHNVYLTGAAGSGKTYVLNEFIKHLHGSGISVGVTASTGIAATHMNGMTIHSWAGIGILDDISEQDLEILTKKAPLKKRMNEAKVLIIDEVSMLHGKRLDMIDIVCRAFKNAEKPFGGLQVVLCGDLFQLPPITRGGQPDFVFQSNAWDNMNLKVCYLGEQYRQEDQRLLDVLGAIRANSVDESHFEWLEQRFKAPPSDLNVTKLYTHNSAVDSINNEELEKIEGETKTYHMSRKGNKRVAETLALSCLAPDVLELKLGAEVMFVANNPSENYVNGSRGQVVDFDSEGLPIVQVGSRRIYVQPYSWKLEDGQKIVAEISQLPLRLAWAITVHKSQGMSLDAAEVDLAKSFEPGMGYVALSRVRSLDGLYIKGINNTALMVHPIISELDVKLKEKSDRAKSDLKNITRERMDSHHQRVVQALQSDEAKMLESYDEELFKALKKWRTEQAKEQSVPTYMVLADKTLKFIAAIKPTDSKQLSNISGIGEQKLERYSKDILELTTS